MHRAFRNNKSEFVGMSHVERRFGDLDVNGKKY